MAIVKTRYLDVPFEELDPVVTAHPSVNVEMFKSFWAKHRGKPVEFHTPPAATEHYDCKLPHFWVVGRDLFVCGNIAEIGD